MRGNERVALAARSGLSPAHNAQQKTQQVNTVWLREVQARTGLGSRRSRPRTRQDLRIGAALPPRVDGLAYLFTHPVRGQSPATGHLELTSTIPTGTHPTGCPTAARGQRRNWQPQPGRGGGVRVDWKFTGPRRWRRCRWRVARDGRRARSSRRESRPTSAAAARRSVTSGVFVRRRGSGRRRRGAARPGRARPSSSADDAQHETEEPA